MNTENNRMFEYMVLFWDGSRSSLYNRFKLCRRGLDSSFKALECEGLLGISKQRTLGIFKTQNIHIPRTQAYDGMFSLIKPRIWDTGDRLVIDTELDRLFEAVHRHRGLRISEISRALGMPAKTLSWAFEALSDAGLISLKYRGEQSRVSVGQNPTKTHPKAIKPSYFVTHHGNEIPARLNDSGLILSLPTFSKPLNHLLSKLMDGVAPKGGASSKKIIRDAIDSALKSRMPFLGSKTRSYALAHLADSLRMGPIECLLSDKNVTEIKAKGDSKVYIKHMMSQNDWIPTNILLCEESIRQYAHAIASETDQHIDASNPLLDAVLHTNDRVNISLPKTSGGSTVMEIRVFDSDPFDFARLIRIGTISSEAMALVWLAIRQRMNIMVSGETGCGKTSFVNAICLFMPKNDHIVTVEDTREIRLPRLFGNSTHLTTCRVASEKAITMDRLLLNALRMDPSHLIMGEVRSKADIEAVMGACAMGHPVLSTIHSRDCETTVKRFEDAGIPSQDMRNINLNIVMESVRDPKNPSRRVRVVKQIAEYSEAGGRTRPQMIYRFDTRSMTLKKVQDPHALMRHITDSTGCDKAEIIYDLIQRQKALQSLADAKISRIDLLCDAARIFEAGPEKVLNIMEAAS